MTRHNIEDNPVVADVAEITPNLAYLSAQEVNDVDEDDVYNPIWNKAKVAELISHVIEHGTWTVVPLPPGRKAITSRWVVKRKTVPVSRLKARFTLRGFMQREGDDYGETYAPVAKLVTVRVFLSLIAILGLSSWQLDIKTAFLNAPLEEEVYSMPTKDMIPLLMMVQKELSLRHEKARVAFQIRSSQDGHVLKVVRAGYGLKQAPREWFLTADEHLRANGLNQLNRTRVYMLKR